MGAIGDSDTDEWQSFQVPGLFTWPEFLVATGQADFGQYQSYPAGDPRSISGGWSYEYNFAAYSSTTVTYLGLPAEFVDPPRIVENYYSQVGSPSHPQDWGGIRQLGLDGTIEYVAFFIGQIDFLLNLGGNGLGGGPRPDIIDGIFGRIVEGLDIATANGTSPLKVILLTFQDYSALPAWELANIHLTPTEKANIQANIIDYNSRIHNLAQQRGCAVVGMDTLWDRAISPEGLWVHGIYIEPFEIHPVGAPLSEARYFYLPDGFHPTPIIQGLWANELLKALVDHYGETDVVAFTEKELVHFTGLDVQDAPVAHGGGPYSILVGEPLTLDASASFDADVGDVLSYSWDVNGDGVFGDAVGLQPTLTWPELVALGLGGGSTCQVRVRVDDGFYIDGVTISDPTPLIITGPPAPVARAGGPYPGVEGQAVVLSASGSTGSISSYEWDLDGDGQYDDASGVAVSWLAVDNGEFTVAVRVSGPGGSSTAWATIVVESAAPVASLVGPDTVLRGEEVEWQLSAADPSPSDQSAGFTFEMDWDGDGDVDATWVGSTNVVVARAFFTSGEFSLRFRAIDKDGVAGEWTEHAFVVVDWLLRSSAENPGRTDLHWGGTEGDDHVVFASSEGAILVHKLLDAGASANVLDVVEGVTGVIVASGHGGADWLDARGLRAVSVGFHGGSGDDTLEGGQGPDTLMGDDGADVLYGDGSGDGAEGSGDWIEGGAGDDVIFGDGAEGSRTGSDTIHGGAGNDTIHADGSEGAADQIFGDDGDDFIDGGPGNDVIDGGAGNDILLGGDGAEGAHDTLLGGDGRDILVGDGGGVSSRKRIGRSDVLRGGAGEDILIAGVLAPLDGGMLAAIQAEWLSSRTYAQRVANLSGTGSGPRENGDDFLVAGTTVFNDRWPSARSQANLADLVLGEGDLDWLFLDADEDIFPDTEPAEMVVNLSAHPSPP